MTSTALQSDAGARSPRVTAFGPLQIAYDDRVLEPRPWTTLQSLWAADLAATAPPGAILELCCGAGQIGLLAAHESGRDLIAVDADEAACDWTRHNARAAGLASRVAVRHSRLEDAVGSGERFAVIIADPPWVPRAEVGRFPEDPLLAIDGGDDGLDLARACLAVIEATLHTRGSALLQIGPGAQIDALEKELPDGLRLRDRREEPGRGMIVRLIPT